MNNQTEFVVYGVDGSRLYSVTDYAEYDLTFSYPLLCYEHTFSQYDKCYSQYLNKYGIVL